MSGNLDFNDAYNIKYCVVMLKDVDEILELMRIEEEPPIDDTIQHIQTFAKSDRATNFKGFEPLHKGCLEHKRPMPLL